MQVNSTQFTQFLRLPEVKKIFGYRSTASVYGSIKDGLCTKGILISQRSRAWPDVEIRLLAAARIQGFTDAQIRELVETLHAKRADAMAEVGGA